MVDKVNYAEMSDFEINKAVGMATGEATVSEPIFNQVIRNINGREFNPCNSWADAGPIIEENSICLIPLKKGWLTGINGVDVKHENPIRAAMIAFLMMQEGK